MPGEIAEMMLNGLMCEGCGVYMDDFEEVGYPRYCSEQCARDRGVIYEPVSAAKSKPHVCPTCQKRFRKEIGLKDHARDAHGVQP